MNATTQRLLESEINNLMVKITVAIRVKLTSFIKGTPKWSGVEIYNQFGFPMNRQSELKDPVKYPDTVISKPLLRKLIAGGFITVAEIEKTVVLTERERSHLRELSIHEDKTIHEALITAIRDGFSPDEIAKAILMLIKTT